MTYLPVIRFKLTDGATLPEYKTEGAACFDIESRGNGDVNIAPGAKHLFKTGLHPVIPLGYELAIRPRSSSCKNLALIPNSPGTIDRDYSGEILICLFNMSDKTLKIEDGTRIAQARLQEAPQNPIEEISADAHARCHAKSGRGTGGFGSTGGVGTLHEK